MVIYISRGGGAILCGGMLEEEEEEVTTPWQENWKQKNLLETKNEWNSDDIQNTTYAQSEIVSK